MKKLLLLATIVASLAATGCRCGHFGSRLGACSPVQAMSPIVMDDCNSGCTSGCTSGGCNEGGTSFGESYQGAPLTQQYGPSTGSYGDPIYTQPEMIVPGPVIQ